jgi:hypothetical protein
MACLAAVHYRTFLGDGPGSFGTAHAHLIDMTKPRIIRFVLLAIGVVALAGCATMTVSSHVERAADFGAYQTYAWGEPDALPTGDPRLDSNFFFKDHVIGAVEKQLAKKGLMLVDSGSSPDLRVHYHANVTQRIDVDATDRRYGYTTGSHPPEIIEYEQGTLVVDVVDARTNRLVWRGWAQDGVITEDQDRLHRQLDDGVPRMFERFPFVSRPMAEPPER